MSDQEDSEHEDSERREGADSTEYRTSRKRLSMYQPDAFTVGYDASGATRIGLGTAEGKLERLVRQNEGRHHSDGGHSSREAARDKKRIVQSFCSSLDVTPHQQREAVSIIGRLNLDRFGSQKRLEKVALCVIRFVVDQDRQRLFLMGRDPSEVDLSSIDFSKYPQKLADDPQYQQLCKEYGVSSEDRYSISQLIKRELKERDYFTSSTRE